MSNFVVGVDVGATKIAAQVVNTAGKPLGNLITLGTGDEAGHIINNIIIAIESCVKSAGLNINDIYGIGLGVTSTVAADGTLIKPNNLPSMRGINLKKLLGVKYKPIIVEVENDANSFILGEAIFGKAKGYQNCCGVTLGTGLGLGIIINGKLYRGAHGDAGEIWPSPYWEGINVEHAVSGRGISILYKSLTGMTLNADEIAIRAHKGDSKALEAWGLFGERLGFVLSYIMNILDPGIIVLGGSVATAYDLFISQMHSAIDLHTINNKIKIEIASNLNVSPVVGAASLVLRRIARRAK